MCVETWDKEMARFSFLSSSSRSDSEERRRGRDGGEICRTERQRSERCVRKNFFFRGTYVILYYIGVRDDVFWTTETNAPRFPRSFLKKKKSRSFARIRHVPLSLSLSNLKMSLYLSFKCKHVALSSRKLFLSLLSLSTHFLEKRFEWRRWVQWRKLDEEHWILTVRF